MADTEFVVRLNEPTDLVNATDLRVAEHGNIYVLRVTEVECGMSDGPYEVTWSTAVRADALHALADALNLAGFGAQGVSE